MVCRAEGIQCSGSAALGSPCVNRDVGTARPVYISSILTGTSQPGIAGTTTTLASCAYKLTLMYRHSYTERLVSRFVDTHAKSLNILDSAGDFDVGCV